MMLAFGSRAMPSATCRKMPGFARANAASIVMSFAPARAEYAPSAPKSLECPPPQTRPESPCKIVRRLRCRSKGASASGRLTPGADSRCSISVSAAFCLDTPALRMFGISGRTMPPGCACTAGNPLPSITKTNRIGFTPRLSASRRETNGASNGALTPRDTALRKERRSRWFIENVTLRRSRYGRSCPCLFGLLSKVIFLRYRILDCSRIDFGIYLLCFSCGGVESGGAESLSRFTTVIFTADRISC